MFHWHSTLLKHICNTVLKCNVHTHIFVTKWFFERYGTDAFWDLSIMSILGRFLGFTQVQLGCWQIGPVTNHNKTQQSAKCVNICWDVLYTWWRHQKPYWSFVRRIPSIFSVSYFVNVLKLCWCFPQNNTMILKQHWISDYLQYKFQFVYSRSQRPSDQFRHKFDTEYWIHV